jgi:glycogen synthase
MPVRVLCVGNMYPPHHLGGYELVWQSAVSHLRSRGDRVEVLTTGFRRPEVSGPDEPGLHRELRWWWRDHEFPRRSGPGRLALELHNRRVFVRRLRVLRPDIVSWWSMGGMSLSLIAQAARAGTPSVAFVHDDWLVYGPMVDQWTRMLASRPRAARLVRVATGLPTRFEPERVSRWLFVSEFTRRRALDAGLELGETGVLSSGIDERFLGPAPEREWAWRLLYVGRIDERKGAVAAVAALRSLPEEATLTVLGDGDEEHLASLHSQVAGTRLDGRVRLEPGRSRAELIARYDEHDAVLFPVRWDEPWGLVPLEAMARGRPVVATGTGGSAEYLRDGENALLVPPDDADALAAAVRRLAGDAGLRGRLREAGRDTAARHTEGRFNAGMAEAIDATCGRAGPRGGPPSPRGSAS